MPPGHNPDESDWLLEQASSGDLTDVGPTPILRGRRLIGQFGMSPGPEFRPMLAAAFEAQLDGELDDVAGGVDWLRRSGLVPER